MQSGRECQRTSGVTSTLDATCFFWRFAGVTSDRRVPRLGGIGEGDWREKLNRSEGTAEVLKVAIYGKLR
jgi:hypothetical protein